MTSDLRSAHKKTDVHTRSSDIQHFTSCLRNSVKEPVPYPHYHLRNLFDHTVIDGLLALPFDTPQHAYHAGTREEFNAHRCYLDQENIEKFDVAARVAETFLAPETIQAIERMGNISLQGSFLRMEYAIDRDAFWLKPHTDLGVKLVTILIYLSKDDNVETWGTDVYQDADTHVKTFPYASNTAMMFFPADNTWHGFQPRTIAGIRKSLIVNYVTDAWLERAQLAHPTQPVY